MSLNTSFSCISCLFPPATGLDAGCVFSPSLIAAADLASDAVVASVAFVPAAAAVFGYACSQKGLLQRTMKVVFLFSGAGGFDSGLLPWWVFRIFLVSPLEGDRTLKLELFCHMRRSFLL